MQNYNFSRTPENEVARQPTSLESKLVGHLQGKTRYKYGLTCTRAQRKMGPSVQAIEKNLAKIVNILLKAKYELNSESLEPLGTKDTREVCVHLQSLLHKQRRDGISRKQLIRWQLSIKLCH